ncbi:hypothetical protein FACS1894105_07370 [Clostridia bacterium]|nr:hypothetical protein FACS1894105_07370 [Clostridia bacterium]
MENFQHWVAPLIYVTGTLVAFAAFYKAVLSPIIKKINMIEDLSGIKAKLEQLEKAQLIVIRDRLIQLCLFALKEDSVECTRLSTCLNLYDEYKSRGGNGFVTNLVEEVKKLRVI